MKLNKNTKKAKEYINNFEKSNVYSIWQAYDKPSRNKARIFDEWQEIARQHNATNFKITTFSKFVFTLGFVTTNENGETVLNYITPSQNYQIVL